MTNEELQRLLMATFSDEAAEQLQAINQNLLALEKASDAGERQTLLEDIFREAHSLKGAARAVELPDIERIAHELESLFGLIKNGTMDAGPEHFDLVYRGLDGIQAMCDDAKGLDAQDVDVDALVGELNAAVEGGPVVAKAGPEAETAPEPVAAAKAEPVAEAKAEPAPAPAPAAKPKPKPKAEAAPAPAPRQKSANQQPPTDETVRVATSKLDALMAQVGELLAARVGAEQRVTEVATTVDALDDVLGLLRKPAGAAVLDARVAERLGAIRSELAEFGRRTKADSRRLAQVTTELQDDVRRTRMLPVSGVFDLFPRQVRDLARETNKQVKLVIEGGETEVDRSVLEQLKSPLQHLVRNCIDHGLEQPGDRVAFGKPPEGTVVLSASQRGANLIIEVSDDGGGIALDRVRAKAVANGLVTEEQAEAMSDREALWMIFRPGFSTRAEVTDLSGRGVGMDVVRQQVERLHGMIDVESTPGRGSIFSFSLPLSVATTRCLLVRVAGRTFGIPITNVDRIVRLTPADIQHTEGREAIRVDERPMALARLGEVLGVRGSDGSSSGSALPAVILGSADRRVAFLCDELVGAQEVAMKSLPRPLIRVRHIAGACIVGTGEVVPILNVADMLRTSGHIAPRAAATAPRVGTSRPGVAEVMASATGADAADTPEAKQTILVADDSVTIRTLEKTLLEAAGYIVKAAADGAEAWDLLQASPEVELVISDVEMPRMTGFEFAQTVRGDGRYKDLPFVLMTTLNSPEDRERGISAGADAYIVKGSFEQDKLLETVRRLV